MFYILLIKYVIIVSVRVRLDEEPGQVVTRKYTALATILKSLINGLDRVNVIISRRTVLLNVCVPVCEGMDIQLESKKDLS